MTDDQDLYDWRRSENRKAIRRAVERSRSRQREEAEGLARRYADERVDDVEPPPRVD